MPALCTGVGWFELSSGQPEFRGHCQGGRFALPVLCWCQSVEPRCSLKSAERTKTKQEHTSLPQGSDRTNPNPKIRAHPQPQPIGTRRRISASPLSNVSLDVFSGTLTLPLTSPKANFPRDNQNTRLAQSSLRTALPARTRSGHGRRFP